MVLSDNYIKFSCSAISYAEYVKNEGLDYTILPDFPEEPDIELCKGKNLIPLYRSTEGILQVGYIDDPDFKDEDIPGTEKLRITYYDFRTRYIKYYGNRAEFTTIPVKVFAEKVVQFAIENKAIDITTWVQGDNIVTTINAKGRQIPCTITVPLSYQREFVIAITGYDINERSDDLPVYCDNKLDSTHIGRCVITYMDQGKVSVTIRIQENSIFNLTLKELHLQEDVFNFLRDKFADDRGGLRLVVGKTGSGKNTTILSVLKETIDKGDRKIVSIECPVERELPGVIQHNCKNDAKIVKAYCEAIIRWNADMVYISEITDTIGESVFEASNKGVKVISTIHANSLIDVILRLVVMTGRTKDEVIQVIHSIYFQRLLWDEKIDNYRPIGNYVYLSDELKSKLYGQSQEVIYKVLKEAINGDNDLFSEGSERVGGSDETIATSEQEVSDTSYNVQS